MVLVVTEEALYFKLPVLFVGKMIQFCIFVTVMLFVKHVKIELNGVKNHAKEHVKKHVLIVHLKMFINLYMPLIWNM
jgi:hypothetical protein